VDVLDAKIRVQCTNNSQVSKHSRAARRNEISEPEAKSLASLPRAENTDLASAMIRATTAKNENLLNQKMHKKEKDSSSAQITKKLTAKQQQQASNLAKQKMERAIMQNEILQDKILKSKQRSKEVQTTRKQNWDMINQSISEKLKAGTPLNAAEEEQHKQNEMQDEDAMEEEKFWSDEEEEQDNGYKAPKNAFDLLNDEVEA